MLPSTYVPQHADRERIVFEEDLVDLCFPLIERRAATPKYPWVLDPGLSGSIIKAFGIPFVLYSSLLRNGISSSVPNRLGRSAIVSRP